MSYDWYAIVAISTSHFAALCVRKWCNVSGRRLRSKRLMSPLIVTAKGRTIDEAFNNTLARFYTLIENVDVFDENAIQYTDDVMF